MTNKLTEGQYRVGTGFNPSNDSVVDQIKQASADLIDKVAEHGKDARCTALAQTAFEEAAMWAVKSVTKPAREVSE